jgi:hypothetical protein
VPTVPSYLIPFDENGSLMPFSMPDWCRPSNVPKAAEWRPREPFPATLTLAGLKRHRKTHMFYWTDPDDRIFPMFPQDLRDLILAGAMIEKAAVTGRWRGIKRSENYGVCWVGP